VAYFYLLFNFSPQRCVIEEIMFEMLHLDFRKYFGGDLRV
jgi:hypothetical protein